MHDLYELMLNHRTKISIYLALPCNQQETLLHDVVETFKFPNTKGCILTKLDEANHIAPALSVIMQHQLPLAYLCNGRHLTRNLLVPDKTTILQYLSFSDEIQPVPEIVPATHFGITMRGFF